MDSKVETLCTHLRGYEDEEDENSWGDRQQKEQREQE